MGGGPSHPGAAIKGRTAALVVIVLLALFAILSWLAISSKSSTYDEPVHALGSWLATYHNDHRIDPENPPLWQHWAALPQGEMPLVFDRNGRMFEAVLRNEDLRYRFAPAVLYQTPGNDGEAFVRRSRGIMLWIGMLLGAIIALWGWRLGGGLTAIVATALYALDPNFLGHAPLVKNDVALAAAMTWSAMAIWLCGQKITWLRAISLALALTACVTVKFSGLIAQPEAALLLAIRAMMPAQWNWFGRDVGKRVARLGAVAALLLASALVCWGAVWACYHFRFDPTDHPGIALDDSAIDRTLAGARPAMLRWAQEHHLLPQAYVHGFLYQLATTQKRPAFLMGRLSTTGWWYYFPLAMLFKTPVTTAIVLICAIVGFAKLLNRKRPSQIVVWSIVCLAVPFAIYLCVAMSSRLNIGLRHVFPLYPLMYVAAGVVAMKLYETRSKLVSRALIVLLVALCIESFAAFPNYIAYFNVACGGSRGGIKLLGDSNLDWGQDLPALAQWQSEHPNVPLLLFYFGSVDPGAYHITFRPRSAGESAVLAISATCLQGMYIGEADKRRVDYVRKLTPIEILDGTIYLYNWTDSDERALAS